mmetsp:Transcript_3426/g.6939  ORF Transcript_3426/g.6939 Transcript_3426/m.6939 type:complete len:250 (+) Transcript_3426:214-963(+)
MVSPRELPRLPLVGATLVLHTALAIGRALFLGEVNLWQRVLVCQQPRRQVHHDVPEVRHAHRVHPGGPGFGCHSVGECRVAGSGRLQSVHTLDLVSSHEKIVQVVSQRRCSQGVPYQVQRLVEAAKLFQSCKDAILDGLIVVEEAIRHLAPLAALPAEISKPKQCIKEAVDSPSGPLQSDKASMGLLHPSNTGGRIGRVVLHVTQASMIHFGSMHYGVANIPALEAALTAVDGLLQTGHHERISRVKSH